jgi:hypothetical protein
MNNSKNTGRVWVSLALAAAGVAAIILAVIFLFGSDGADDDSPPADADGSGAEEGVLAGGAAAASGEKSAETLVGEEIGEEELEIEALPHEGLFISGVVTDKETGEPVPLYSICLHRRVEKGVEPWEEILTEEVNDGEGRFFFPLSQGGKIYVRVRSAGHHVLRDDLDLPDNAGLADLHFVLDPGISAPGFVVDDFTGLPVPGAIVAHADTYSTEDLVRLDLGFSTWVAHAVTDEDGSFRLFALPEKVQSIGMEGKWLIAAIHPDYAEGVVQCAPGAAKRNVIRLGPGRSLFGRVADDDGNPAAGAVVTLSGKEIPLPRSVVTGSDGSYRTAPVQPGLIYARAGPPPGAELAFPRLTTDTIRVQIGDADVEVNFGPSSDHVTWRGQVLRCGGEPIPDAVIELAPAGVSIREKWLNRLERRVECDGEGRFDIRRLAAKTFAVNVKLSSWAHNVSIGKITFDGPGVTERDIRIAGAEIHGVVIDRATGEPPEERGWVNTHHMENMFFRHFSSPVDEEGRFALFGMPAGTYRVSANYRQYPMRQAEGVIVEADQILRGLRIELVAGGIMNIRVEGFAGSGIGSFRWDHGLKGGTMFTGGTQYIDESGRWEISYDEEPGHYLTKLIFSGLGTVVREFEIVAGRTTTVVIDKNDLAPPDGRVTVSGTVTRRDGSPVEGVRLHFYGRDGEGADMSQRSKSIATDSEGRFEVEGFWAGNWSVTASLGGGAQVDFPQLYIPPDSPGVAALDLILSAGRLTGFLRDRKTGLLLEKGGAKWWAFLKDRNTGATVCEIQGGETGPQFEFLGVPAGSFTVLLRARGYEDKRTDPFTVDEGASVSLGDLLLNPCGILIVELANQADEPVTGFEVKCNGAVVYPWDRKEIAPGKYRFFQLPAGPVTLTIDAKGYVAVERSFSLEAGVPQETRIVLTAQ